MVRYSWFNPDEHSCYYFEGQERTSNQYRTADEDLKAEATNVSQQLKVWTIVGFAICCLEIMYSCTGFIFQYSSKQAHARLANCFLVLGQCNAIGWVIWGTVIRWNSAGRSCSGDYWEHTSNAKDIDYDIPFSYSPYLLRTG